MANSTHTTTRKDEGTSGMQQAKHRVEDMASSAADRAKSAASGAMETAKNVAGTVMRLRHIHLTHRASVPALKGLLPIRPHQPR